MDRLVQWTAVAVSIRVTEARIGLGGSPSRTTCEDAVFTKPETKYIHPGNTWVNYMLYSLFGLITLAMLAYIVFIHVMRHIRSSNKRKRAVELSQQSRPNSAPSEDAITSREILIS